jgi:hypothetical protein
MISSKISVAKTGVTIDSISKLTLTPVTVRGWIEALFPYAINPEYDPVTGDGRFLTLERVPDIASYETDE